jgi:membrane-associated phospholipid phosphatase
LLTSEVNHNTNVFPSLHASLSLTVAFLSLRTRTEYGRWPLVAVPLALSVSFATMYLGIHWATDVVAGAVLAVLSIKGADLLHDRFEARIERSRELWGSLTGRSEAASS